MENKEKVFHVEVKRIDGGQAIGEAHGEKITLSTNGKIPSLGMTAPEAVLASFGACIVSNVNKIANEMELKIDDVEIKFEAKKRLDPLGFEGLNYEIAIYSKEPVDKLQLLYDRSTTNGTATNALLEGLKPERRLTIK